MRSPTAPRRFLIYAPERLGALSSKTANGLIKFRRNEVVAVLDPSKAGRTVQDVLGYGGDLPIVDTLAAGRTYEPDTLVVGIAPIGGRFTESWLPDLFGALEAGMEVWSGLHQFLADLPAAKPYQDRIWDMRRPPMNVRVAVGSWRKRQSRVLLSIGSDCNIGKMTASLILQEQLRDLGIDSVFVGTGQTGMAIAGRGVAIDAVVSDFINGVVEEEVEKVDGQAPLIIVEGQGALTHQGYSAVTAGVIHGCMPDDLLLIHQPTRLVDDYDHPLPPLREVIALHELMLQSFSGGKVRGVSIYSKDMSEAESDAEVERLQAELGLPTEDIVRRPNGRLAREIAKWVKEV